MNLNRETHKNKLINNEEDRIGRGKTARGAAWLLNKVNAGETIGGPAKGSKKVNAINKGAYQSAGQIKAKTDK